MAFLEVFKIGHNNSLAAQLYNKYLFYNNMKKQGTGLNGVLVKNNASRK
jgi:hypothetical protein